MGEKLDPKVLDYNIEYTAVGTYNKTINVRPIK